MDATAVRMQRYSHVGKFHNSLSKSRVVVVSCLRYNLETAEALHRVNAYLIFIWIL